MGCATLKAPQSERPEPAVWRSLGRAVGVAVTRAVARYSNGNHQRSALLPIERQRARARKPRLQSYNPISASAHLAHFLSYVTHETQVATQAAFERFDPTIHPGAAYTTHAYDRIHVDAMQAVSDTRTTRTASVL